VFREAILSTGGMDVIVMDSASQLKPGDRGHVVIAGSNGGQESGRVGAEIGCALLVLNDAGVGKEGAGIAGLEILERAGVPAATVSHLSAAISDGRDMWYSGLISHVNGPGRKAGIRVGDSVASAVRAFMDGHPTGKSIQEETAQ